MRLDMTQLRRKGGNDFRETPEARIGRSTFDRSHTLKTTFDASQLIPILVDEILPGDTMTCKIDGFIRIFAPLKAPIMDNIEVETFFFFVPTRLIWENWEKFNGAQDDPADSISFTIPSFSSANVWDDGNDTEKLASYFGIPDGLDTQYNPINALPFRAYALIYNEWFRDENLIDSETVRLTDGGEAFDYSILKRAKRHDRFTSCLPWTQKGTGVAIPITNAPLVGIGVADQTPSQDPAGSAWETGGVQTYGRAWTSTEIWIESDGAGPTALPLMFADNSAVGITVNQLRESVAIQRLLEMDARGGTRYVEHIKSHFGVTSPDFRLQRPEYLGGGKSFVNVSPIAQTAEGTTNAEVGTLAAVGAGSLSNGHGFGKSFTEHGYVLGIISARGDITYQQGLEKMWSKSTRYDFYVPALANLGEDAVLNRELFISNVQATDDAVFGYQERWYDYRTKMSMLTGKFRSAISGTLDFWHLAQNFGSLPTLAQTFIEDATPMARITAVSGEPDFIADLRFDYRCARPLPVYSIPSLTTIRF